MIKKLLTLSILSLTLSTAMADILIIGDSHTVGPFGELLHKNLAATNSDKIILSYGHSSSAPVHWMNKTPSKLSGGINARMSHQNIFLPHPNLPNWRERQSSQNLIKLLNNPVKYASWKTKIPTEPRIDTIVIALGANDRSVVSTDSGARTSGFNQRVEIIGKMLDEVVSRGIKCIWIGPPSSISRSKAKEQTTHEYLLEGIKDRCPLYDSRKFEAKYCDRVHFNCSRAMPTAKQWAQEAADFVNSHL